MRKIEKRSDCPISSALDILGDRWTLLVIRDLMFRRKSTYGELLDSKEGIATNILADRLATLAAFGLVEKRRTEGRARPVYALTRRGLDLMPMLLELISWSDRYLEISDRGRKLARRFRADRDGLMAELKAGLAEPPRDEP